MGYAIVRAILNFFFFVIFGLKVEGRENVPKTGAIIVAPNHKSYWDPPVVGVAFNTRIIHYMAKEELFKNPFFGWLIRQFGTFPVKRGSVDRAAVRQAIKEIKEGNPPRHFPGRHPHQERRTRPFPHGHGIPRTHDRHTGHSCRCPWHDGSAS